MGGARREVSAHDPPRALTASLTPIHKVRSNRIRFETGLRSFAGGEKSSRFAGGQRGGSSAHGALPPPMGDEEVSAAAARVTPQSATALKRPSVWERETTVPLSRPILARKLKGHGLVGGNQSLAEPGGLL